MALESRGSLAAALATVGRECENEPACAAAALMSASLLSMEAATSMLGRPPFAFRANSLTSPLRPAAREDAGEDFCRCDLFIIELAAAVDVTCETWISAQRSAA